MNSLLLTHKQSWQSNAKLDSPRLLHSYPPCAVQIHLVWGGIIFQFSYKLSSVSRREGVWQSKVTKESWEAGTANAALVIHLGCKQPLPLLDKSLTHNQAHYTHQDSSTHLFFISRVVSWKLCLQVVFGLLLLIGNTLMFLLWFLDVTPSTAPERYHSLISDTPPSTSFR